MEQQQMNLARSAGFLAVLMMLGVGPTIAQDHGGAHMQGTSPGISAAPASPYAGMEKRPVKALSDQQIADLKAGRGMGLALAAELNGYPGPLHVLEFADALELSDDQRTRTKALLDAMKGATIPIGERIIADETALDRLFAERSVTRASLEAATARIAAAQGELRAAHLRYHLAMVEVLSPAQIARYATLRGYAASGRHNGAH
jgi:Spy/CpxP family protein refolding chaperone